LFVGVALFQAMLSASMHKGSSESYVSAFYCASDVGFEAEDINPSRQQ
jgi:hypothetical protein